MTPVAAYDVGILHYRDLLSWFLILNWGVLNWFLTHYWYWIYQILWELFTLHWDLVLHWQSNRHYRVLHNTDVQIWGEVPCAISVTVTTSKSKVVVHENSNAVLPCEFKTEKDHNPRIEWKKKGKEVSYVYFEGKFRGSFKDRASIDGATLTLRGATPKDSGVYRCEVSAPLDHVILGEINVTLTVLVPPHTPACTVPATAMSGTAVEMSCKDKHSDPAPTYSWYKDNKPLSTSHPSDINYSFDPKTGTLKFKSVSKADAGQYRCEASNGIGAPKSCPGQTMKITEFQLNLTLVSVVGAGGALFILLCCLGICLCYRRGCCCCCRRRRKEMQKERRNKTNHNPTVDTVEDCEEKASGDHAGSTENRITS
ncbi:junctional adhesion molecule 2b [Chanos chanos]|uniref:Junctional adhesion molecule 2b n=1 Tax=Chanos chanos TaxID=29144 RepID=A0A6J2WGG1_CHACN|nr:junctional adhesion molecule B-like [Chanos chanos]